MLHDAADKVRCHPDIQRSQPVAGHQINTGLDFPHELPFAAPWMPEQVRHDGSATPYQCWSCSDLPCPMDQTAAWPHHHTPSRRAANAARRQRETVPLQPRDCRARGAHLSRDRRVAVASCRQDAASEAQPPAKPRDTLHFVHFTARRCGYRESPLRSVSLRPCPFDHIILPPTQVCSTLVLRNWLGLASVGSV